MDYSGRDIKYLKGVGPQRALLLNKELNIRSVEDLLYYFPYKYVDRSRFYRIKEINGQMPYIQIRGRIEYFSTTGEGRNKRLIAEFSDGTDTIELVWFKGIKFITNKYRPGEEYIVFGKPTLFGSHYNIAHPEIETVTENSLYGKALQPSYNTTERMKSSFLTSKNLHKIILPLLESLNREYPETLPMALRKKANLMEINEALWQIHNPTSPVSLREAQYRFKFEELFYLQLNILQRSVLRKEKIQGHVFTKVGNLFYSFYEKKLPFELTNAQKRVIKEIRNDFRTGKQMNRLLQGDVGSGKTLVALMIMLIAIDNGFQAALMAPTEILATQHFETLSTLLDGIGVNVALLTGSTKKKEREIIHTGLRNGDIHLLIGTHALIEDEVLFQHLGLAIIDEQHRFGVAQRARLWNKGTVAPHVLVMTATPIPRTLAMTFYGDLDVSVIDELPPGRKPIQTIHVFDGQRAGLYRSIRKQIELGRQVYIVYPLIKESENLDYKNLEDGFEHIKEIFPDYQVSMIHGKMKPAEKELQMARFVEGSAQILLATTVIEVGVNVPNASVMLIENAERFGLSQLHQLRGRVGRGAEQSYCILVTSDSISEETRKRIEVMTSTNDGFEIAEADLKMRGPGDLEGTQQSGIPINLHIANLAKDGQVLQYARDIATEILAADPQLSLQSNALLRKRLNDLFGKEVEWGQIS
ncbi:MAG: ATP-dependent DNA helicase RecG [Bacteroidales bacterium]|nr:ATP-dependent DNA helicase RecG [Bacteroidales bacterium]